MLLALFDRRRPFITTLRWLGGGFWGLVAFGAFLSQQYIPMIYLIGLTLLVTPLADRYIFPRVKRTVPLAAKILLAFFFVFAFAKSMPETTTPAPVAQESVTTESTDNTQSEPTPTPEVASATEATTTEATPEPTPNLRTDATFSRVVDGDTLEVLVDGKKTTIRVIGINTPETVDPRKSVECFGKEASAFAKKYFAETDGKLVLERDPSQDDKDKYQRSLRYVFSDDGAVDYGAVAISLGYAHEYTYDVPYQYQDAYKQAQKEAEAEKRGLWADDACPSPTPKPTSSATTKPATTSVAPAPKAVVAPTSGGAWSCNCAKTCGAMSSCAEAQYQLNTCGCSARDADDDGVACDSDCQ